MPRKILTPEERKIYAREYRRRNKDKINRQVREWKKAHPELMKKSNNKYLKAHPEKIKQYEEKYKNNGSRERYRLKSRYGITPEDVRNKLTEQGHVCPICFQGFETDKYHIDHCHQTGQFRGLLHLSCNTMLGNAKDIPDRLESAARYLRRCLQYA